jgi:hypothetical protein
MPEPRGWHTAPTYAGVVWPPGRAVEQSQGRDVRIGSLAPTSPVNGSVVVPAGEDERGTAVTTWVTVKKVVSESHAARISLLAARLAIGTAVATLLLLTSLHVLSPEFAPSWRMVSEYALGRYGWVLALMFLAWGISSWALAIVLWPQVPTRAGKVGACVLIVAGVGEAMAAVFDITHDAGHSIAGALGMGGFPIAAVVLSLSLGRAPAWRSVKRPLLWLAHLSWISVVLLGATLMLMSVQATQVLGHVPQQAPTHLPAGVLGLDGWADRLFVLASCAWALLGAVQALKLTSHWVRTTA